MTFLRGSPDCSDVIDFKYHIISLVAVFLALAVGIVLGAGPLRGQLSDTLEGQVAELGQERNDLRARVDLQQQRAEEKDDLVATLVPGAVRDTMSDRRVGLVKLPGADSDVADAMAVVLRQSGADVVDRTDIADAWEDPGAEADRESAAQDLLAAFAAPEPAQADPAALLMAHVVAGPQESDDVAAWTAARSALEEFNAIEVRRGADAEPGLPGAPVKTPPEIVIVLSGGIDAAGLDRDPRSKGIVAARVQLISQLHGLAVPTVVIATGTESFAPSQTDAVDPLVTAIRSDNALADVVSTVDNAESAAGRLVATWATADLLSGNQGHYGLGPDAQGPAPARPSSTSPAQETGAAANLVPPAQSGSGDR